MLRIAWPLALLLVFAPAVAEESREFPAEVVVEAVPGLRFDQAPSVRRVDDAWARVEVQPGDGRIAFVKGEHRILVDEEAERQGGGYVQLHDDGERLYAFWWTKLADASKRLYVRVSEDRGESFGPTVRLDTDGGVLPKYHVAYDGEGRIAVAYLDERRPKYQIYFNRSTDGGETWLVEDVRIDSVPFATPPNRDHPQANDPFVLVQDGVVTVIWKEARRNDAGKEEAWVQSRSSTDWGETWQDERNLAVLEGMPVGEYVHTTDGALWVFMYHFSQGYLGFVSRDAGLNWETIGVLPESEALKAITQTRGAVTGDRLGLVFTYEPMARGTRPEVHFAAVELDEARWAGPLVRLDRVSNDGLTRAWLPDVVALSDTVLLAGWEDTEGILANVLLSVSEDQGRSWSAPYPLGVPGRDIWERPVFSRVGDELYLFFDRWQEAGAQQLRRNLMVGRLPLDEAGRPDFDALPDRTPVLTEEQRLERLRERAEAFWAARVRSDFETTYTMLDPAFRARFDYLGYAAQQRGIVFHAFELVDVRTWDNIGGVAAKVSVTIPPTIVQGQEISLPMADDLIRSEWVWLHDDWYFVQPTGSRGRFLEY